jgi:hypothetical protein
MTASAVRTDWTRPLSRTTLELIYSQATDRRTQREALAELDRRDDEDA